MNYIYVGKLMGTHGLKGELKFKTSFNYKEKVLKENFPVYIEKEKYNIKSIRKQNDIYLIAFNNYKNIEAVENLKNKKLFIKREDLNLNDNEFVFEDYIGLDCYYNNENIGKVIEIVDCGNKNYVFYIKKDKEILIPLNKKFIEKVILNDKIIFKEVGELIDAN